MLFGLDSDYVQYIIRTGLKDWENVSSLKHTDVLNRLTHTSPQLSNIHSKYLFNFSNTFDENSSPFDPQRVLFD